MEIQFSQQRHKEPAELLPMLFRSQLIQEVLEKLAASLFYLTQLLFNSIKLHFLGSKPRTHRNPLVAILI